MNKVLTIICVIYFLFVPWRLMAAELSPSATVSLLIASPDTRQLVTVYGHTLLRINDPEMGIDYVFNYGTFDQSLSGFQTMWGILRAKLQYEIWVMPFSEYYQTTLAENRKLTEYSFNFSNEEKQRIWLSLIEIVKDKNRKFTFDFFSRNCTTFVRDLITQSAGSEIKLPDDMDAADYREINIRHIYQNSWYMLAYDFLAGMNLDKKAGAYESLYTPDQLQNIWSKSLLVNASDSVKPLFSNTSVLIKGGNLSGRKNHFLSSPFFVSLLFLLAVIVFTVIGWKSGKYNKSVDYVIFSFVGVVGIFLFILKFASGAWCFLPDLKMCWIHPLHLVVPFLMFRGNVRFLKIYHLINMVVTAGVLIIIPFLAQQINPVFIVVLILLLFRSALFVFTKKPGNNN